MNTKSKPPPGSCGGGRNFLSRVIRSSNDGIVATDEHLGIVVFNPGAERIFGYPQEEVVHKRRLPELLPENLAAAFLQAMTSADGRKDWPWTETELVSRTGERIPVRFSGSILNERGKKLGVVAFIQDLREIKGLQLELVRSERLAAIGQTVAGLAHGIKNVLHGLKGGSYLVDVGITKNDSQKLQKGWDMIKRSIDRTSNLVMDLLSYSKEREPEYEECAPNEIAAEVCDLVRERAQQDRTEIVRDFDPAIGRVLHGPAHPPHGAAEFRVQRPGRLSVRREHRQELAGPGANLRRARPEDPVRRQRQRGRHER